MSVAEVRLAERVYRLGTFGCHALGAAQAVLAVSVRHTSFPYATSSEPAGRLLLDQMLKAN